MAELNGKDPIELDTEATGYRIRELMIEKQLSVKEICEKLNVSFQAVYKWQRGENVPSITNLFILAQLLDVEVGEILVARKKK